MSDQEDRDVKAVTEFVAELDNKQAWGTIEEVLREGGYQGYRLKLMRDRIWAARRAPLPQDPRA